MDVLFRLHVSVLFVFTIFTVRSFTSYCFHPQTNSDGMDGTVLEPESRKMW